MAIRIITDDNNKVAAFKTHDDAIEYLMNAKNIAKAKKTKGTTTITSKKEYDRWIDSL